MHFIVLFTGPQNRKESTRDYKMYGYSIAVWNPQSEYNSHHALAEVSILIPSDDARGVISWGGQGRGDREIIETVLI